jgi:N-acetyl-anhydromuramyl-L-alanine amidase AmpD
MAQSPEYPDLKWVPPKSWTNANRTSVQLIVVHSTEGSAHSQSAEDGAAYNQRRDDGTSAHYFVDSNTVVHCVRTNDQAHTARAQGNRRGIQYELCTKASSSAATWGNAYHQSMLRLAAKQAARDAKKWNIPVRHLTVAQVADGVKGFCSHWDITRAFPQDSGSHTDPGPNFPWSQFLDMVRDELEDEMQAADFDKIRAIIRDEVADVAKQVFTFPIILPDGRTVDFYTVQRWLDAAQLDTRKQILDKLSELHPGDGPA